MKKKSDLQVHDGGMQPSGREMYIKKYSLISGARNYSAICSGFDVTPRYHLGP